MIRTPTAWFRIAAVASFAVLGPRAATAGDPVEPASPVTLAVPPSQRPTHVSVPWPGEIGPDLDPQAGEDWILLEAGEQGGPIPADCVPEVSPDGSLAENSWRLVASIPPAAGRKPRRFTLVPRRAPDRGAANFRIGSADEGAIGVWEGDRPVLVYNHGVRRKEGVPPAYDRSSYVHPIYGLDGEVLTDDFPEDHLHHRGLFWTWPHVRIDGEHYDLWLGGRGIEQRFERWLAREAGRATAVLGVENGWYVGDRKVMTERIWLTVRPATGDERAIDVACYWEPTDRPVTLAGAEGKSYGGLTLRFAPRRETVITTLTGSGADDQLITRLPWADLTARFAGAPGPSGAAVFVAPDHPDFPPEWMTRHYGVLCVGWPGVEPQTLEPGKAVACRYRAWIHRDPADAIRLGGAYEGFRSEGAVRWEPGPATPHPEG